MKVVALYCLHYGSEWLFWSMRSIKDFVDDIVVVYSPVPSHGHGTEARVPDDRDTLVHLAGRFDAKWTDILGSRWEGEHRDEGASICESIGADIVLVVDHDEIWEPEHLQQSLEFVKETDARDFRIPFQHYYRSVGWVCHDLAQPVRFHRLADKGLAYVPGKFGKVHHYGYAQSSTLVDYKWKIHGHLGELRPNWYQEKFLDWTPGMLDVHPTNLNFWNPEPFDRTQLVDLISDHPYYSMDIIP